MSSQREAFRKYLESGNVIETLNRAMIQLHEQSDKQKDPLNFIRNVIGAQEVENVDELIRRNQYLHARVIQLKNELELIKSK